ncbi:helix-turn-helix domain containing protein [Phenylobacterium sp. LjRoot219]|uniref:TetR/AcrR family transcriptional regulator n=1 Tax=Phenylobacterium sp. LjRoot219 TaxID=3342283 RepID=UPI003ECDF40C
MTTISEITPTRRMGPNGSATWNLLLDGAEAILREEGYAELTSRRIANRVGIKQQLVYYYFRTMDELMVEAFRRLSKRELERLGAAVSAERPLHEVWGIFVNTNDARLISEFMALANRSEGVRAEVIAFIEASRRLQVEALTQAIARKSGKAAPAVPPLAATFLATSVALALTREAALGVSMGHAEVEALIEQFITALEP